jgi:hypothetical protein
MPEEKKINNDNLKSYLPASTKASSQLNKVLITLIIIIATNVILNYTYHFGYIPVSLVRQEKIDTKVSILEELKMKIDIYSKYINPEPEYVLKLKELKETKSRIEAMDTINTSSIKSDTTLKLENISNSLETKSLPGLNIQLHNADFAVIYYIIGTIFIIWLFYLLIYIRSLLKIYFNNTNYYSENTIELTNQFNIILPLKEHLRYYRYIEGIIVAFVVVLLIQIISDCFDACRFDKTMIEKYGYLFENKSNIFKYGSLMAKFWIPKLILWSLCLAGVIYIFIKIKVVLKDIRNILLLIKWGKEPILKAIDSSKEIHLDGEKTFLEYRNSDNKGFNKLLIISRQIGINGTKEVFAGINLAQSFNKYLSVCYNDISEIEPLRNEEDNILISSEKILIEKYFIKIFTDNSYEPELYKEIKKL